MTRSSPLMALSEGMASVTQFPRPQGEHSTEPPSISDGALVEKALSGSRWAEDALVRRHLRKVYRITSYLLGDLQEVDDVVQDAFLLAFEDLRKLRDPEAFRSWLIRIAVHRSRRVIRRQRMLRKLGLDRAAEPETLESLAAPALSPEACADLAVVEGILRACSANDRIAWTLRHVEGCSVPEVAEACACSESTAKRRIRAAQARVAALVEVPSNG